MGLLNALNCDKEDKGLGLVDCEQFLSEFKTPILIKKGWSMTVADFEALDYAGFVALVQSGDWQPVEGAREFVNNTPEATTQEYSGGVMAVVRNGKPQYQFNYDNGYGFHAALYSKNSFNKYDMGIVDDNGTLILAYSADGLRVTGLTTGMVNTSTFTPRVGDANANTPFAFQLTNEAQFNKRMALYNVEQSGIDFNTEIKAIVSVEIAGTATAGDPINVTVTAVNNANFGIEGLDATNFRIVNTATNAVLAINTVANGTNPGQYVITPTVALVAAATITIEMYDATESVNVAIVDALEPFRLYKGISPVITVGA